MILESLSDLDLIIVARKKSNRSLDEMKPILDTKNTSYLENGRSGCGCRIKDIDREIFTSRYELIQCVNMHIYVYF